MSTPAGPLADSKAQLKAFLPAFTAGVERYVVEVRALNVPQVYGPGREGPPRDLCGFFELTDRAEPGGGRFAFCQAVRGLLELPPDRQPSGIYLTLNPVSPDLLARVCNRLKPAGKRGVSCTAKNVLGRRWLLVDVDPVREAEISSTDAEKAAAKAVLDGVRADLDARGWPAPMVIDSGNGFHLWYRIDLPADDGKRVEGFVKRLADRHDTPAAKIDRSVFDPPRIAKIPGTYSRKGDGTPDRPHRLSRVLEVPA